MRLIPVDPANETHIKALYDLLAERTPEQSISHKKMPTWDEHRGFVAGMAYLSWELICQEDSLIVGSVYVTQGKEIGISVFNAFQRQGYANAAIRLVMKRYPGERLLANVNPANTASLELFEMLGFRLVQCTLEREAE